MSRNNKDQEDSLEWIPRSVRDKLDRVAIRLHLAQWQRLSTETRAELVRLPCETPEDLAAFRSRLEHLIAAL